MRRQGVLDNSYDGRKRNSSRREKPPPPPHSTRSGPPAPPRLRRAPDARGRSPDSARPRARRIRVWQPARSSASERILEPLRVVEGVRDREIACRCAPAAPRATRPRTRRSEWMSDCGWRTTSIRSGATPKRKCASRISSPLFIIVAESIVIFGPIFQVGCAKRVVDRDRVERRRAAARPERPARSRQDETRGPPRTARTQGLVDRAVLGVDRDDLGARCVAAGRE